MLVLIYGCTVLCWWWTEMITRESVVKADGSVISFANNGSQNKVLDKQFVYYLILSEMQLTYSLLC